MIDFAPIIDTLIQLIETLNAFFEWLGRFFS